MGQEPVQTGLNLNKLLWLWRRTKHKDREIWRMDEWIWIGRVWENEVKKLEPIWYIETFSRWRFAPCDADDSMKENVHKPQIQCSLTLAPVKCELVVYSNMEYPTFSWCTCCQQNLYAWTWTEFIQMHFKIFVVSSFICTSVDSLTCEIRLANMA